LMNEIRWSEACCFVCKIQSFCIKGNHNQLLM
jgi:hypothetical protein